MTFKPNLNSGRSRKFFQSIGRNWFVILFLEVIHDSIFYYKFTETVKASKATIDNFPPVNNEETDTLLPPAVVPRKKIRLQEQQFHASLLASRALQASIERVLNHGIELVPQMLKDHHGQLTDTVGAAPLPDTTTLFDVIP